MIKINSTANGFVVEGVDSPFYPYEGKLTFPTNEVVVETEEDTEMALFRSASNFDVLFSGLIEEITIDGQSVTKENIHEKFSAVANAAQGGGGEGGMTPEEKQELKDVRADVERALGEIAELDYDKAEKSDVYTKEEVDEKIAQGGGGDPHYVSDLSAANDGKKVEFTDLNKEVSRTLSQSVQFDLFVCRENNGLIYTIIEEPTYEFTDEMTYLTTTNSPLVVTYIKSEKRYMVWSNSSAWSQMQGYVNGELVKDSGNQNLFIKAGDKIVLTLNSTTVANGYYLRDMISLLPNTTLYNSENSTKTAAYNAKMYKATAGTLKLTVGDKEVALKDELDAKQDKLTAGEGITIEDNVISATGGAGGDEHYKSEVVEGMDDAPVMTMINGTKTMVTPNPSGYGNIPREAVGNTYEASMELVFRKEKISTPAIYVQEVGGGMQYQVAYWNSSEGCLVFNGDNFWNSYLDDTIWYVNGEVVKENGQGKFINGKKIYFTDEWNQDSSKLKVVDTGNYFDMWEWDVMLGGCTVIPAQNLQPREQIYYNSIDNAMEIDFRGNKYHLNPKENFKTINGQSIIGTGNLTVTDSSTQSYSSGTATSGTYYKINGSAINKWNTASDDATNYSIYVKNHIRYHTGQNNPAQQSRCIAINQYTEKESVVKLTAYTNAFRINTADVRNAEPTYIANIDGSSLTKTEQFARGNEYYGYGSIYITPDNKLVIDNVNNVHNELSQYVYLDVYVSDTKDGEYTKINPTQLTLQGGTTTSYSAVALEADKWYKIIYSVDEIGGQDYNLFDFYSNFQNKGSVEVLAKGWVETEIDDSLYYQHGTELTPILTQKNISKYVDINGGGGADLSNYPTKQEVNQTYLQKTGTYIKSAEGNGGHILFQKGDGQNDSVNFKTINNQGIIGEGNISVPQIWSGTEEQYNQIGVYDKNTLYCIIES